MEWKTGADFVSDETSVGILSSLAGANSSSGSSAEDILFNAEGE